MSQCSVRRLLHTGRLASRLVMRSVEGVVNWEDPGRFVVCSYELVRFHGKKCTSACFCLLSVLAICLFGRFIGDHFRLRVFPFRCHFETVNGLGVELWLTVFRVASVQRAVASGEGARCR